MNIKVGEHMFKLRQYTGIPFTRLAEITAAITYKLLQDDDLLREDFIKTYSIRSPEKQIELDKKKGYDVFCKKV